MYNDSDLSKAQWEEAEALSVTNEVVRIIFDHYKKSFNGSGKNIVKTFDTYIQFVQTAVEVYCEAEYGEDEDGELIQVGFGSDSEAIRKAKILKLISSKDDKGSDRIKDMLKGLADIYLDRQTILDGLGKDDKEELDNKSKSGSRHIADLMKQKNTQKDQS